MPWHSPLSPPLADSDPLSRPKLDRSPWVFVVTLAGALWIVGAAVYSASLFYGAYTTRQETRHSQAIYIRNHLPKGNPKGSLSK